MTQHTLELPDVDLVYDVFGPLPTADGQPPMVMIGQPMDASGFQAQVKLFEDRTVVTYDPRGLGRSKRKDGGVTNEPETQARDVHAIIEALGAGPVEMLASSGGAVTALALVTVYPDDVSTLVAHEPPIDCVLPDAEAVQLARAAYTQVYQDKGWGAGMAAFIAMTSWEGEVTDEHLAQLGGEGFGLAGVAELATHEAAVVAGEDCRLLAELFGQCDRAPAGIDLHRLLPERDHDPGRRCLQGLEIRLVEGNRPGSV